MVFASLAFLYLFLPLVLGLHWLLPRPARNLFLLIASLGFYALGEGGFVLVLVLYLMANHLIGKAIARAAVPAVRRLLLVAGILGNLLPLLYFKYARFLISGVLGLGGEASWLQGIHLPIGISFFAFQGISYLVDIWRRDVEPEPSLIGFGLYKAFFPQLIAGPVVRYRDVAHEVTQRSLALSDAVEGCRRFAMGLAKKVLVADVVAPLADSAFAQASPSPAVAWVGVVAYALQIYFDFSGYSDMAIGLARLFGFRFRENFDHPYAAGSIRDFWRRWHISLSTWFRDYLYIPLGGSRRGPARVVLNLLLVFALCGLWHGANWTFVVWGIFHGLLLGGEHLLGDRLARVPALARHCYVILAVLIGWVLFRADSLDHALRFLGSLAGCPAAAAAALPGLDLHVLPVLVVAVIGASGLPVRWWRQLAAGEGAYRQATLSICANALTLAGIYLATITLVSSRFSPFIYFRF